MKRNILKGAFWVLLSISTVSCSDFLDINPHDSISDAAVWENMDLAEAFLNNCYTYVEGENENGVPFCSYTDELFHRTGYATEVYTLGNVSCDNYNVGFSEARGNTWNFYYSGIKKVNQLKPFAFYIVDTLGAMSENDMMHMLHIIDRNLDENVKLGYHSHNNLQLAFANAQRMMEFGTNRDVIIDCSVYGMGRGAGNLCTELMVDFLKKHYNKKYDAVPILEIVDNYLLPIYMQKRWGYTIEYFLASSLDCHPNYVSFLMDKQNIPVRVIRNMLEQIPKEKRLRYNAKVINDIYSTYQNNSVDDRLEILNLREKFKGENVLIVGSGKSVKTKHDKIAKYILKNKPKVIAINFVPSFKTDMVFVANQKRFEMIKDSLDMKNVICTSNIDDDTKECHVVNYSTLLNSGDIVGDSSGMMLLKLLRRLKVSKVAIAGMDGFKRNCLENYCEKRFVHEEDNKTLREKNKEMKEQLKLISKEINIEFITPSKYCD